MSDETQIAALSRRIDELEHQLGIQQDIHAVRRLQYAYGYFIDKSQYDEVVDLFPTRARSGFFGGIYRGKAGIRRLYIERFRNNFTEGHNGPRYGWLLDHLQIQMIVDVAPDRRTASVRGRSLMQAGLHETASGRQRAWWEGGTHEHPLRAARLGSGRSAPRLSTPHGGQQEGWAKTPIDFIPMSSVTYPEDPLGPDALLDPMPRLWPATDIVPFHYEHPVTGKPIEIDNRRAREGFNKA